MGGTGHRVGEQTARMIIQPVGCVFTRTVGDGGEDVVRASTHPTLAKLAAVVSNAYRISRKGQLDIENHLIILIQALHQFHPLQ